MKSWRQPPVRAAEVCDRYEVGEEVPPPGDLDARAYFEALCAQGHEGEAVTFLAHALPRRETIWWGCLCLWDRLAPALAPAADVALREIVQWILEPSEPGRRAVVEAGELLGDAPLGLLSQAVKYAGETMTAPGQPIVPPPPFLAQRLVAGAIRLAVPTEDDGAEVLRYFLQWGADLADGRLHWNHA